MSGRRSRKKALHPADQFRKLERKKVIKKNKMDRKKTRQKALERRDAAGLMEEIKKINRQAEMGLLTVRNQQRRAKLLSAHKKALKAEKEQAAKPAEEVEVRGLHRIFGKGRKTLESDEDERRRRKKMMKDDDSDSDSDSDSDDNDEDDSDASGSDDDSDAMSDEDDDEDRQMRRRRRKRKRDDREDEENEDPAAHQPEPWDDDDAPFFPPGLAVPPMIDRPPGIRPPLSETTDQFGLPKVTYEDRMNMNPAAFLPMAVPRVEVLKPDAVRQGRLADFTPSRARRQEKDAFDPMNPNSANYLTGPQRGAMGGAGAQHPEQLRRRQAMMARRMRGGMGRLPPPPGRLGFPPNPFLAGPAQIGPLLVGGAVGQRPLVPPLPGMGRGGGTQFPPAYPPPPGPGAPNLGRAAPGPNPPPGGALPASSSAPPPTVEPVVVGPKRKGTAKVSEEMASLVPSALLVRKRHAPAKPRPRKPKKILAQKRSALAASSRLSVNLAPHVDIAPSTKKKKSKKKATVDAAYDSFMAEIDMLDSSLSKKADD